MTTLYDGSMRGLARTVEVVAGAHIIVRERAEMGPESAYHILRTSADPGVFTVDDVTHEFAFIVTEAPESYDYGSTLTCDPLYAATQAGTQYRLLAIPERDLDLQTGRYGSGLYSYRRLRKFGEDREMLKAKFPWEL